jgi:hypothetical protein
MLWSPPSGFGATVHMATPDPTLAGRHVSELLDTWHPRSSPWLAGWIQSCRTHRSVWVHDLLLVLT